MLSKLHALERVHALHNLDLCTFMLSTIVCVDITTSACETFDHNTSGPCMDIDAESSG